MPTIDHEALMRAKSIGESDAEEFFDARMAKIRDMSPEERLGYLGAISGQLMMYVRAACGTDAARALLETLLLQTAERAAKKRAEH